MPTTQATCEWKQEEPAVEKWDRQEENSELKAEIGEANKLAENWDDEGSPAYSKDTLDRAAAFLTMQSDTVKKHHGLILPVPRILPGPDGSIDIHWKRQGWELLVNIPSDPSEMAVFYGDDYGSSKIKGSLDPKDFNLGIAAWLMR